MLEQNNRAYTQEELDGVLFELRRLFTIARVLKENEVGGGKPLKCYEVWGKDKPCANCTSFRTLFDKKDRIKYEYLNGKPVQVISEYADVDNQPCVIEILKDIDNVTISPEDARIFAENTLNVSSRIYKDVLTGVLNRTYYEDNKNMLLINTTVIFLDINDFKTVNDMYGHKTGDDYLRCLGNILNTYTRKQDSVIRYGGDEFVIIIPDIAQDALERRINDIKATFAKETKGGTISLGVVKCERGVLEKVVENADKEMYKDKKNR